MKTPQVKPDWNYGIWNGRSVMVQDTHDPNYGDNTTCDLCKDVFDARNSDYEVINNKWICGRSLELVLISCLLCVVRFVEPFGS